MADQTPTEEEGIKMIQHLQLAVGINESEDDARAGWNSMDESEQRQTTKVYRLLKEQETLMEA